MSKFKIMHKDVFTVQMFKGLQPEKSLYSRQSD